MTIGLLGLGLLCSFAFTQLNPHPNMQLNLASDSIMVPAVGPQAFEQGVNEVKSELISPYVSVSNGFADASFPNAIKVAAGLTSADLVISSDAERSIQYTMSDVDGKILLKRFFRKEQKLPIGQLAPGQYALYFFAGEKVVRAVLVEKLLPSAGTL